ncbi:expressed unknown protein [Seminavis robusta]|uniref:VWFD domain-containing protein n=1 Tax=Seminavis robusta TaxID=568900 RepID=A0A9N8DEE6_9STRA|nr:expressed unknown protein [Seminavis robusta]|eukprot:Sro56_g032700.1 n/a (523) ;mRNA; f:44167-45911
MVKLSFSASAFMLASFAATAVQAKQVILYQNDFEAPKASLSPDPANQLLATPGNDVNTNYGAQGGPNHVKTTHGDGHFGQQNSVETLVVHSTYKSQYPYSDPDGRAGDYSIGMLADYPAAATSDFLWLDFTAPSGQDYFNVQVDISAISASGGMGPNTKVPVIYDLILIDMASGQEVVLETKRITGTTAPNDYTFAWTRGLASFNKGDRTDLRIKFDAIQPSYSAIDNLLIYTDEVEVTTVTPPDTPIAASTAKMSGDPHVQGWGGRKFDFHGGCDLVLLSHPEFANGLGLHVHVRTKIQTWWSYIETAVVQIGDQMIEMSGGSNEDGGPNVWVNGVAGARAIIEDPNLKALEEVLEAQLEGFHITYRKLDAKQHRIRIDFNRAGDAISLQTYKDWVAVSVKANKKENFKGTMGLMGRFPNGDLVARDGVSVMADTDAFGKEWQVLASEPMLFHSIGNVPASMECAMPSEKATEEQRKRRLGESSISTKDAEQACARVSPYDRDQCIFDVLATNDMDMAGAY